MDRTVMDRNLITAQGYAFVDFTVDVCRYLNIFERHLVDELHEINKNLKSINCSLSLLTSSVLFSEEKNEDNKDGRDTESDNTI